MLKELTLGEILLIEHDHYAVVHDPHMMRRAQQNGETVRHIPRFLSQLCLHFVEDGGDIDAEVIGKRFNTGQGMRLEVPVDIRFTGNLKCFKNFRAQLVKFIKKEFESKAVQKTMLKTLKMEKSDELQ